ncbi:MAG: branched-chain amino acid ABC transporter permease [Desulfurococcales archaeon]|nr:branched-chain amino acid ABC transporter permease [Desulfurococcales archaeon]
MPSEILVLQSIVDGVILGLIYALAAMGLSLAFGVMHIINVAHGDFIILGSFLTYTVASIIGLDPLLGVPLALAVGGLIGYGLQRYVVNRIIEGPPLASLVFFFGLAIALPNIYIIIWGPFSRSVTAPYLSATYNLGPVSLSFAKIVAVVIAIAAIALTLAIYYRTKLGLAMRATIQNRQAALVFGVNIYSVYSVALAISLMLAGLAGSLIAMTLAFSPVQGALYTLLSFLIVVLGGMGYIVGSLIAGLIMGLIQSITATYLGSAYVYAIMFMLLYIVLLISPKGILGRGV